MCHLEFSSLMRAKLQHVSCFQTSCLLNAALPITRYFSLCDLYSTEDNIYKETFHTTPNLHYEKQLVFSSHVAEIIYISDSITCSGI